MHSLNGSRFGLSQSIESLVLSDGRRLMKQIARAEYLALDAEQQKIIDRFDGIRTVQEILHSLLLEGVHPKIRRFYDLILQAVHKGFLFEGREEPSQPLMAGRKWDVGWGYLPSILLSFLMILLGTVAILGLEIVFPRLLMDGLKALLFLILGLSVSELFAGCVLSGFGRQVYRPRVRWDRVIPFFSVDTRDAFMGGKECEACVALQKIAGSFLVASLAWFQNSGAGLFGSCLAILILTSPFGDTPAHNLLYALFRKEYQLPRYASKFLRNRAIVQIFDWRETLSEEKYLLLYSTYAICWLGALFRFGGKLLEQYGNVLIWELSHSSELTSRVVSLVGLLLLAFAMATPVGFLIWMLLKSLYRFAASHFLNAESSLLKNQPTTTRPEDSSITQHLRQALLFSQLPPAELPKIASVMKFVTVKPKVAIIRERDMGDALFSVYSGRVEVLKEDESGQLNVVAHLGPGDVFGEIALLDRVPRTSTVRSTESTSLLVLPKSEFEQLVVSPLGSGKVKSIIQVCAFLKRNPLFADWHPQALMSLSMEFVFCEFQAGDSVIREGQVNESFFLVYEGKYDVRKKGMSCAILGSGDFCGEISLLRDAPATADVIAIQQGRCLKLGKERFLKFVSQDFLTGMAIESTLESRLGGAKIR